MSIDLNELPPVSIEDYDAYTRERFQQQTDQRIAAIPLHVAPLRDDWMQPNAFQPPTPSDALTRPQIATPDVSAQQTAPEATPATDPSAGPANGLPAPDAPVAADFRTYSGSRIASLDQGARNASPSPSGADQAMAVAAGRTQPSSDLVSAAMNAASSAGIDPSLFVELVRQESNFNPKARSPVGAAGLTQLMPDTARSLGVTDPFDINQNLAAGARYFRQNLDRFGGDVTKALAAYNAGPGAVEKYGGIPPYKETQTYVDKIMSGLNSWSNADQGTIAPDTRSQLSAQAATAPGVDVSQFGDPQLTTEEAYAACGPAAAVRFAQRFGRNPSLREAIDLARQVGWTPQQGMAGLQSEKDLMDRLQVPTKLVQGAQWDTFAKEAQTGNPVTISTSGHYFTADGYNPDTGAFHVGRSGLDLKGGAEWMTPVQMTNLMGSVQGGLLADNPQVPSPSTADQDTNPLGWLGRAKDALGGVFSGAANAVFGPGPADMTAQQQPTPSDTLTNPTLHTTPTDLTQPPAPQPTVFDRAGQAAQTGQETLATKGVPLGQGEVLPSTPLNAENFPNITDPGHPANVYTDLAQKYADPSDPLNLRIRDRMTPEDQAKWDSLTVQVGGVAGSAGYNPKATASPELQKLGNMFEPGPATATTGAPSASSATSSRIAQMGADALRVRDDVFRTITRGFTDRQVDINQVQQVYAKALGRPLNADEMAAELQRLSADPAAQVKIDEGLKPAIQAVGEDYRALRDYVTLRSNVQVADALGNDARLFSGGLTKAESQKAIMDLQAELGPDRFKAVQDAADQVSQFGQDMRQRLVDSGVLSQQQAIDMEVKYPDWVKTRILDYMRDPSGGQAVGSKIGLASRDVHAYTQAGTVRAREDPLASTVAYAHQVERMANKNDAFNAMLKIDQASPSPMLRKVAQDFSPTKGQVTIVGFVDGQKVKYVTDNRALGEAINGAGVMATPEWTSAWQKVFRSLATSRNPVFLAGNAALDVPTYTFRTAIREGGPQALPGIMADLARGYGDAFQGLLQGEYRGTGTAAFLKGGGGQSGYFTGGEGRSAQTIASLRRSNVFEITGKADLLRLTKDLLTLKPVEALGERIELGPRVAAYSRALQRGANPVQAVIEGRTVTVDFSQGGTVTKYLNNFVPFLNVGFQGPVQLARAWRDNPRAFVATAGTLIGLPSVAAEVWNRADPQRAKDYADVPDYVKNQGIVVMLPGEVPIDAQGNRKPLYAVLKLREWAPFASIARDATARALGDNSKSLAEMAISAGVGLSPTQSSSVGQLGTEMLSGIPVVPAAAQIQFNKDFFRNRDIVTNRNDQNAGALAKALTPVMQKVVDQFGLNAEIHPSAVEFFIRNQGAGVGGAVLGAGDLASGTARRDTSPTSLPVVGGLVGRFVGNQTGQGLQTARGENLTTSARQILRQNGITSTPGPATGTVNQIPLKLDEETRYQQLLNRYVDEAIHRAPQSSDWGRLTQQGKQSRMQTVIEGARSKAGLEVLNTIPAVEKQQRLRTKSTVPSAPVPAGATR